MKNREVWGCIMVKIVPKIGLKCIHIINNNNNQMFDSVLILPHQEMSHMISEFPNISMITR